MASSVLSLPPDDRTSNRSYMRIVGWALLALGLIDIFYILIGADWMNPVAELRVGGRLAEHALALLLGLLLLLLPAGDKFTPKEARTLSKLSKLGLVLGALYLLLIPFLLLSAFRIQRALTKQTTTWVEQQEKLTQGAIDKLNDIRTHEDVEIFVQPLQFDENMFYEPDLQVLKGNLADRFHEINAGNIERSEEVLGERLGKVWTDTAKWVIASLITAAAFVLMGLKGRRYGRLASAAKQQGK